GLTNDSQYYVAVLNERTIRLTNTLDQAENLQSADYLKPFTAANVSGNAIQINTHPFTLNQPVTYYAPTPLAFHSTQVDVTTSLNNNIVVFTDSSGQENIYFVYPDGPNEGRRMPHGFNTNDAVVYRVTS